MTFEELGAEVGRLVAEKQKAYGDSFSRAPKILSVLYPEIPEDRLSDLLTITRMLDKFSRIATDKSAFNEDPWQDLAGYALLALKKQRDSRAASASKDYEYGPGVFKVPPELVDSLEDTGCKFNCEGAFNSKFVGAPVYKNLKNCAPLRYEGRYVIFYKGAPVSLADYEAASVLGLPT